MRAQLSKIQPAAAGVHRDYLDVGPGTQLYKGWSASPMKSVALSLFFIFMWAPPRLVVGQSDLAFCVAPGDAATMLDHCRKVDRFSEFTEEGEVDAFRVVSDGFMATAEIHGGKVEVLRFRQNPLPIQDVRIGDAYTTVREQYPNLELVTGSGEETFVALANKSKGHYIVFDASDTRMDAAGRDLDARSLERLRVVALNLVEPECRR